MDTQLRFSLFLLYSFSIIIQPSQTQLLSFPLRQFLGSFYIHLAVGDPKQFMMEAVNQELDYSWSIPQYFNISISKSQKELGNTTIQYRFETLSAQIMQDALSIPDTDCSIHFKFLVGANCTDLSYLVGSFGFAFKFKDESFSIIHILKQSPFIGRLAYSFTFVDTKGTFHLGGIPQSFTENMLKGSCKVNPKLSRWSCNLSKVTLYQNDRTFVYNNAVESFFQARDRSIQAPMRYYNYLKKTVFENEMKTKECQEMATSGGNYLICPTKVMAKLSSIVFSFGKVELSINMDKLADDFGSMKMLLLINKHDQDTKWVFGSLFLQQYQSLFDYEDEEVTFYAKEGISVIEEQENRLGNGSIGVRWICCASIGCLLTGVFVLIFTYLLLKDKRNFNIEILQHMSIYFELN